MCARGSAHEEVCVRKCARRSELMQKNALREEEEKDVLCYSQGREIFKREWKSEMFCSEMERNVQCRSEQICK